MLRQWTIWAIFVFAMAAHGAVAQDRDYIAVVGTGRAVVMPSKAVATVRVTDTDETISGAIDKTTTKLLDIQKALNARGLEASQIEFLSPTVEPKIEYGRDENEQVREIEVGFVASQSVRITVVAVADMGEILTMLTGKGAMLRRDVEFLAEDPDALRAKARAAALEDAKTKAKEYAAGSGRTLGPLIILEDSERTDYRLFPSLYPTLKEQVLTREQQGGAFYYAPQETPRPPVPLTDQPVTVTETIYAKFALEWQ